MTPRAVDGRGNHSAKSTACAVFAYDSLGRLISRQSREVGVAQRAGAAARILFFGGLGRGSLAERLAAGWLAI